MKAIFYLIIFIIIFLLLNIVNKYTGINKQEIFKQAGLNYIQKRQDVEFWLSLYKEIDTWDGIMLKENERKVLMAVRILMDSADTIEIFNKKAIYLYLREITGLNTKQVVNNLNKLRKHYRTFRKKWESGEI